MASRTAAAKESKVGVCHVDDMGKYRLINVSGNALKAHLAHGDGQPGANGFGADCSTVVGDPFAFVSVGQTDGHLVWSVAGTPDAVTFNIWYFSPPLGGMGLGMWVLLDETVNGIGPGAYTSVETYAPGTYRIVALLSDNTEVTSPEIIF